MRKYNYNSKYYFTNNNIIIINHIFKLISKDKNNNIIFQFSIWHLLKEVLIINIFIFYTHFIIIILFLYYIDKIYFFDI